MISMEEIKPRKILRKIIRFLKDKEILAIHGSRQVGKTSLLHYIIKHYLLKETPEKNIFYFDLEDFALLELCNKGVDEVIRYIKGKGADLDKKIYLLIDEVQYLNNPSSFLKLFFDRYKGKVKLIVSGSSSFLIKKKFKDSLAGRVIDFELFTLDFEEFLYFKNLNYRLEEVSNALYKELLPLYEEYVLYGGYPAIVLEEDVEKKEIKLKQIINTYIKRDIRDIANIKHIDKFNGLLKILASQAGELLNISELSNTVNLAKKTVEDYLFILESTYIIKLVRPFHKNIRSELTKMPKIFFEDTGILNIFVNKTFSKVLSGQLLESSIYSIFRKNIEPENIYFWRTNKGQEIDFVIDLPEKGLIPLEVKLNCLKKAKASLKHFKMKYSLKNAFVCCLYEGEKRKKDDIKVILPWEIYGNILS